MKKIFEYDFLTGAELEKLERVMIFPAKHFVVPEPIMLEAQKEIEKDLTKQVAYLKKNGKLLEADRLSRRTRQDIEMMREIAIATGLKITRANSPAEIQVKRRTRLSIIFPKRFFDDNR